jgi:hypothetical protein
MHDLVNGLGLQIAKVRANLTGDNNSANVVDLAGYLGPVMFAIYLEAVATADVSNYFTVKVEESDDNTFASGVTVVTDTATRIIGTQLVVNATSMAVSVKKFGVTMGTKRYMRLVFDETGTADMTVSAIAILGGARNKPVA